MMRALIPSSGGRHGRLRDRLCRQILSRLGGWTESRPGDCHIRLYRRRLRATPRFYLLLIAAICVGFSLSCGLTLLRSAGISGRLDMLNEERSRLDGQIEALKERLEYVKSDAYVQRVARDELNMLYPGEIRYIPG